MVPTDEADRPDRTVIVNPRDLGAFLRRTRQRRGITQEDLAADLGISRFYLSTMENGRPSLYTDRLFAAMRDLGIVLKAEAR